MRHEYRYVQVIKSGGAQPTGDEDSDEDTAAKNLAAKLPLGLPWLLPESISPDVVFPSSDAGTMVSGTGFAVTGEDSANLTA